MPKMDVETVDSAQVRAMGDRLGYYVAQIQKCADDMDANDIPAMDAKNAGSFNRALAELNRTVSGLVRVCQAEINHRMRAVPTPSARRRKVGVASPVCTTLHHVSLVA